ncbi:aminoglycoside 6-adenylyltransferase [Staphylococcus coagulans]|nr:aminoglycoside 6-adenylyltransferase [Staphylococcus coagulans]MBT2830324.1 aminoglycoside 6-adenylyltransferase [Staphylococcus coagulans]MBT2859623.1 aminoglycoside 6-adenylyltransferase [Staphylococcus coagulans]MBU3872267.1 aminoglycoside 6-adenylyltransferase [Staphylococcus coagulans]
MRDARDILKLILDIAKQDERIVSVLLNGSRANPYSGNDRLQD